MKQQLVTSISMEPQASTLKPTSPCSIKLAMVRFASNVILIFILISQLTLLAHCSHITTLISSIVAPTPTSQQPPANSIDHTSDFTSLNRLGAPADRFEFVTDVTKILPNHDRNNTENPLDLETSTTARTKPFGLNEAESSTGSISELIDDNYLAAADPDAHEVSSPPEVSVTKVDDFSVAEIGSILAAKAHNAAPKSKRQAYSFSEASDWWTKLSSKNFNAGKTSKSDTKNSPAEKPRSPSKGASNAPKKTISQNDLASDGTRTVYKEQPLSQNAILTIRNQLKAIRGKHKVLVTRSVRQLQQLDTKLIDSYKLCLKKKMPLYAGMLYRTRDFVVRMAKEVKHEREVLEAMTRQVQNVLRQKMTNRTLVRDYNRIVSTSTEASLLNDTSRVNQVKIVTTRITTTRTKKESPSQVEDSTQQVDSTVTEQSTDSTYVPPTTTGKKNWYGGKQKPSGQHHKGSSNFTTDPPSGTKSKQQTRDRVEPAKKFKPIKYTVSVNEVNLKKELNKIQALIDRINGSSHELTAVVDDIVHLFKLSNYDFTYRKGSSLTGKMSKIDKMYYSQLTEESGGTAEQKRMRKMLRSPIRVFFEKYGKQPGGHPDSVVLNSNSTSVTNNSETPNLPEMKPLFDASSTVYTEPTDQELGFDVASNVE